MLRRPMMYITSFFAAAILVSYYFSVIAALILTAIIALFLFSSAVISVEKITALLMTLSMISGVICFAAEHTEDSFFSDLENQKMSVICVIRQIEIKQTTGIDGAEREYLQFNAKAVFPDSRGFFKDRIGTEKVLIRYYDNDHSNDKFREIPDWMIPGNRIRVTAYVESPQTCRNPGSFDYSLYLKSMGIEYILNAENIERIDTDKDDGSIISGSYEFICEQLYLLKESFLNKLGSNIGTNYTGIIRAIMFGEKNEIDESVLEEFQKNGTAHVLAVSGLHVGIIYGFLNKLWIWKKGRAYFAMVIIFFIAYMIMASFSPSVIRAVIMVWLHIFAKLFNRRYDMASAAFFTALMMLLNEPMHIFNTGFQMSFLAVLTLSLLIPVINQFYSGVFLAGIAIQLGLTPYTVYVFNYFSIAALFVNIPIIFLTGIIVPVGMCCMAVMIVFEPLGMIISEVIGGFCIIMVKLNSFTAVDGITVFDIRSPALWIVALYYLILLVFVSEDGRLLFLRKQKEKIKSLACIVTAISLVFGITAGNPFKGYDMVFLDVGQGDCLHIRTGKNDDYLVDGGGNISYNIGKKTLKPYLLKNGTKDIDGAFITHLHTDHYKGIAELCLEGMVERIFLYEGYMTREAEILEDTGLEKEQITYLHAGQKVKLSEHAYVEVLWPEEKSHNEYIKMAANTKDENQFSLIMKITIKGRSVMMTGDVDSACLDNLAETYGEALDTDILKAAHHGSKYSTSEAFEKAAEPEYAVFQVGKNNFGHPDKGVVENFRQKGIMIYRNDTDGAVAFDFRRNGSVKVRTVKGE